MAPVCGDDDMRTAYQVIAKCCLSQSRLVVSFGGSIGLCQGVLDRLLRLLIQLV